MKRVVIVGAGPAGSAAAMEMAGRGGVEIVVLDRGTFPRRKACGSGLSPWALAQLDEMGVGQLVRREAHPIHAARVGGPRGQPVELRGTLEAAVLLRARLDTLLIHEAARRGAQLREGITVSAVVRNGKRLVGLATSEGQIEADAVIDCSGANTRLSRAARPGRTLHTTMGWFEGVQDVSDAVELYFDPVVKPYYGWVFPEGPERVNVGICYAPVDGAPNARERFAIFVADRLGARMRSAEQIGGLVGHPISTTHWPAALSQDGLLTAGEAGRLVDPATAEGIHHALASGRTAGRFLADTFARGQAPTEPVLSPYTRAVRAQIGGRLMAGGLLLQAMKTPVFDFMLQLGGARPVQSVLTWALAGA